ncbi:PucR family transcriptional regulator [Desulfotruncus alcoholivorax]|uniref:PucR family transcriptional regulator n=1 Tax=Desulfotruncus alcoholivorax TaxID=265477 RepID=UPI000424AAAE|nr:PucR family transcriptional regulator [Desulfotruncus alcoholivorax]
MFGVTVNELLELLKGHGAILKAGGNSLSNVIETVSVLEVIEYQQWLRGGELFLSTLSYFTSEDQVCNLVKDLREAGSAALAIHPGVRLEVNVKEQVYKIAEDNDFPIIILPRTIPYSTVYSLMMNAMIDKQEKLLEQSKRINQYLTEILLTGGSFEKIASSLQKLIQKPVLIADSSYKVLAALGTDGFLTAYFIQCAKQILRYQNGNTYENGSWQEGNLGIRTYTGTTPDNKAKMLIARVAVGRDVYGYVVTLGDDINKEELSFVNIALSHAATAVALEISKVNAVKAIEERLVVEFLEDLLNGNYKNEAAIMQRAAQRGIDIKGKHVVMTVEVDRSGMEYDEIKFMEIKEKLNKIVQFSVTFLNKKNVVIPRKDSLIVLPHLPSEMQADSVKPALLYLAREIIDEVKRSMGAIAVSIGIGGYSEKLSQLTQSYYQAEQALKIGRKIKGAIGIFDYEQLGVYSFLLSFGNEELKENCRQCLAKVIEYDQSTNGELIKTMEMYLDCNENISKTAEKLYVHPNTVKYRLERIKEILGKNPFSNGEEKLYYHIAVKAVNIL